MWDRWLKRMERLSAHRAAHQLRQMGMYREADDLIKNINRDE
jgi:hypothetical protein